MVPPLMEFNGMYMAEVMDDVDPETVDSGRVRVRVFPMMTGLDEAVLPWAVPAMPLFAGAAADQGSYVVPAKNSKVWVFFVAGDVRSPVYFANAPGMTDGPSGREPEKMVFKSRSGHVITVSDVGGSEEISVEHKDGEKIVLTNDAVQLGKGTLKKLINEAFQTLFNDHVHEYLNYPSGASVGVATKSTKPIDPLIPVPVAVTPLTGTAKGITAAEMTTDTKAS